MQDITHRAIAAYDLNGSDPAKWMLTRAADLLEQCHPTPVPASERLPRPEDCDGVGRCWWWNPPTYGGIAWWSFEPYEWVEDATHWLPAHALPLPAEEVEP